MTDRLTIRFAYQRGWQVVDGRTIVETFDTDEEAFGFLVARDARVRLEWSRTVIGGNAVPLDFSAKFQARNAGRIIKEMNGPSAGTWWWFSGSLTANVATKDEAVFAVERAFTRRVAKADWPK
ncbi:MAG: hypothetical protein EOS72_02915 [Mesorhizobium sp.]|uniref:hypothetical protein n=1 Tax=Mesorhizobium sp. TaxID=1871066 RepID=UPI000FE4E733|nr:hypothetical protein [Mesorhizobium sp.]RWC91623.1 MAG: hypothetical protein EOS72_02915 [Mesorhizobium sp.]